jgi:hypothetical protein
VLTGFLTYAVVVVLFSEDLFGGVKLASAATDSIDLVLFIVFLVGLYTASVILIEEMLFKGVAGYCF